jgi:hypothetical protein
MILVFVIAFMCFQTISAMEPPPENPPTLDEIRAINEVVPYIKVVQEKLNKILDDEEKQYHIITKPHPFHSFRLDECRLEPSKTAFKLSGIIVKQGLLLRCMQNKPCWYITSAAGDYEIGGYLHGLVQWNNHTVNDVKTALLKTVAVQPLNEAEYMKAYDNSKKDTDYATYKIVKIDDKEIPALILGQRKEIGRKSPILR